MLISKECNMITPLLQTICRRLFCTLHRNWNSEGYLWSYPQMLSRNMLLFNQNMLHSVECQRLAANNYTYYTLYTHTHIRLSLWMMTKRDKLTLLVQSIVPLDDSKERILLYFIIILAISGNLCFVEFGKPSVIQKNAFS